ncbi:MAG: hypothetical protein JWN64_838 [Parcubacteria group bacterium]|nr:hypothetical protein [Parcubacteria group bacterium]
MNLTKKFGPVWVGSGTRGFFGEGYWFHFLIPSLHKTTLVAKTTTAFKNAGNMELTANYTPKRLFPDCIRVDFLNGRMVNSVSLSGPGIDALLAMERWQDLRKPFMISVMPVAKTEEDQKKEVRHFVESLKVALPHFRGRFRLAIQANVTCPNVGADMSKIEEKAKWILDMLGELGLPVFIKLNLLTEPEAAARITKHQHCSGICISNAIPFDELFHSEFWKRAYPHGSPMPLRYGKGGLSGKDLFSALLEWLNMFRKIDKETYVNAGGGIMRARDVDLVYNAGANSISITSVVVLRPWRIPSIIKRAYSLFL